MPGDAVAYVKGLPVCSQIEGIVRGLIHPSVMAAKGLKIGDIDPRGDIAYLHTISDKGRAIGGAVLECIMRAYN